MSEVIVVTSGKGGVGKTTTSANLGSALAYIGKSVVVLDADIGLRNLDLVMGLEKRIIFDLLDVVDGRCKLDKALIKDRRFENLYVLPATQNKDKDAVTPEQMKSLCDQLRKAYDYVLIDCPAGIEQGFRNAIAGADSAIIVTTPEVSAIRDADRIIGLLESNEIRKCSAIINRVRVKMIENGDMLGVDDVLDVLAIPLIGVIPDDESVVINTNKGEPLVLDKSSISGKAFKNIAKRVTGEEVPILDLNSSNSIIDKIKGIFTLNKGGNNK